MASIFFLAFGGIFTLVSGILLGVSYFSDMDSATINDELVPIEEFRAMLEPKIFLGLFLTIGIVCLIIGIILAIKKSKVKKVGFDTFGIITDIYASNFYVNDSPVLKAETIIIKGDDSYGTYSGEIGVESNEYHIGDIVHLQHYKDDIHIHRVAMPTEVPTETIDRLMKEYRTTKEGVWAEEHRNRQ